jgi:peptidoglycan/LPS O-acetylase OafA/YrhL
MKTASIGGHVGAAAIRRSSIGRRLAEADYRPSGFDYLRIGLAFMIVIDHSILVCSGQSGQQWLFGSVLRPIFLALIPMFFALSGFLVASSLIRTRSVVTFVGLRVLRIVPALAVDTVFCALILGIALTDLPLPVYLRSPDFAKYFLNIVGDIHYALPGVFTQNPTRWVNAQLWTIPYELKCYAALTILAVVGFHRRRLLMLLAALLSLAITAAYIVRFPVEIVDVWHLLLPSFLFGVCIYLYRDFIPWNAFLFAASLIASVVLLSLDNVFVLLACLPITYVTVWCGLLTPKRDPIVRSGDYSYPIYLYSFPIQQAIVAVVPLGHVWWVNFLLAVPMTFGLAAFSWHLVEKPAQSNRHYLYALEGWLDNRFGRSTSGQRGKVSASASLPNGEGGAPIDRALAAKD